MDNIFSVWLIIVPVALIIFLGFLIGRSKINFDSETISNLILYIGSPCLVFSVISQRTILWLEYSIIMAAAFFIMIGIGLLVHILLHYLKKTHLKGFYLPTMLMNTGNVGLPVALFAFGAEGFARALVFDFALVLFMFSIGMAILGGSKNMLAGLRLPVLYVAILSVAIATFNVPVPLQLLQATTILGQLAIPLMLLLLGYRLSKTRIKTYTMPLVGTLIRSFGGLLLGVIFVSLIPVSVLSKKIILLYAVLPSGMMTTVLAQKYNKDPELVASTVALSTLAALFIIPGVLYFL